MEKVKLNTDKKNIKEIKLIEQEKLEKIEKDISDTVNEIAPFTIPDDKWSKIFTKTGKFMWYNKEINACYPREIRQHIVSSGRPISQVMDIVENDNDYQSYGIKWDIQTYSESVKSFYNKWHPLETCDRHRIYYTDFFLYRSENVTRAYDNYPNQLESHDEGILIPIFRISGKNIIENIFSFLGNNLIPEGIKNSDELKQKYFSIEEYEKYIKDTDMNSARNISITWNVDMISDDIVRNGIGGDIFKEITFEITFANGEKEIVTYINGVKSGSSKYIYTDGSEEDRNYKDGILDGKSIYHYTDGSEENRNYKDGILQGKSIYHYTDGSEEKRKYKDGILDGKSTYHYADGRVEKRTYVNGVLQGDASCQNADGSEEERNYKDGVLQGESTYRYADGSVEKRTYVDGEISGEAFLYRDSKLEKTFEYVNGKKMDTTDYFTCLNVDRIRVNLDKYDENILLDPNRGHWDIFGNEELRERIQKDTGKKVYVRDAKEDIKHGGIVGIDFGTKSTVVVFQDGKNRTFPMRISGGNLMLEVKDSDYENPTVIEFKDIESFIKDYNEKEGRPLTKWEDVTVSHTAFQNMVHGTGDEFTSFISELKQWAGLKNEKLLVKDGKGVEKVFPPYMELEDGDIDPIELYAYYIGSYINNMINGIYMEYFLSFPVTYEKAIREKILQSFERGIKKSLPISILNDEGAMKYFKVRHGANEPAAYAVCALQEYGFEPDEDEAIHYGVFDFGGGTADFDFGIWKASENERRYDYELTHFGAGGDRYLGGENILKELAYEVLKENKEVMRKENLPFARPEWCEKFPGDEGVVNNFSEARLNIKIMMEKLRPFWEQSAENTPEDGKIKVNFYAKDGSSKSGVEITLNKEKIDTIIESKIEKGIENFFIAMDKSMKTEEADRVKILLAGNSCKHPKVMELFEKHRKDFKGEIEIFPALGTKGAYEKMEELGIEIDPNDPTNPTGKTGVAYGIIDSRAGGRIDIKNRDEDSNIDNEINFKYYVGYEGRKKFKVVLGPQTQYEQYIYYLDTTADVFDLYYSSLPEAMESKMPIDKAERKRIRLENEYPEAKIYIKAVSPGTLNYVVTEKDIEEKEYLEEGEIKLD